MVHLRLCVPQDDNTPLHIAAHDGHTEMAALLLDWGANMEAVNKVGSPGGILVQLHVALLSLAAAATYIQLIHPMIATELQQAPGC